MIETEKHKIKFVMGRGGFNGANYTIYLDGEEVGFFYPENSDAVHDFIEAIGAEEGLEGVDGY